jgi:hypothetical protein
MQSAVPTVSGQTITFTLKNGVFFPSATPPHYQYEVWVKSSNGTSRTGSMILYLNYSPILFGFSVVANNNVTVTRNSAVFDATYIQNIGDNTDRRLGISFSRNPAPGTGVVLPATGDGVLLCTVQMNTFCPCSHDISFQLPLMDGEQYFDDEATPWPVVAGINNLPIDPLPVQLASFTGTPQANGVRLQWTTASEINNYGFNVQRKLQAEPAWTELPNSFIRGNGTTNEPHSYTFIDNAPPSGSLQYRLKQTDLDQSIHYSEPIQVNSLTSVRELAPKVFALFQNYPNPFNPETNIKFSVETTDRATVEIYNALGQRVATLFDDVAEAGYYYTVRFDATSLASGTYFFRINSGSFVQTKKMLLLR